MKRKTNRLLSILLALLMLVGAVPVFSISASALEKRTYEVDTWSELVSALISQVDADITVTGDIYSEYKGAYTTYNIEGKNTLNLNGHSVEFNAKLNEVQHDMYNEPREVMFKVIKGAELTITDSSDLDLGSISFDAHAVAWRDFQRSAIRDIFEIEGKLTLEAGTIKAGRSKEQWVTALVTQDGLYTGNVNQVIFGTPFTVLNGGELTINGGRIMSYGNVTLGDYGLENYEGKCVRVNKGGKCTVNGGDFYGYAGADIFDSRTDEEHLFVNAGTFTTYKLDDVLLNTITVTSDAPKGFLRIPDYSWEDQADNLEIVVGNTTNKLGNIPDNFSLFSETQDTAFYNVNRGFSVLTPVPAEADLADKVTTLESVSLESPEIKDIVFECKANPLGSYFTSKGYYTKCDMIISRDYTTLYSGNGQAVKLSSVAGNAGVYSVVCYSSIYDSTGKLAARDGHVYTIEVTDGKLVTSMNATITEPVGGAEPSYTANFTIDGIYLQDVDWAKKTGENEFTFLKDGEKFEEGEIYECTLEFVGEDGVYFAEDIWAAINGMDVEVYVSNGGKKLSMYAQFECTEEIEKFEVLFTADSKAQAGYKLTVDLEAMAEMNDEFMEAYLNDDIVCKWFFDGKLFGISDTFECKSGMVGRYVGVRVNYGDNFVSSEEFVIEAAPAVTGLLGDADENSKVNVKDATAIQKHVADITVLTDTGLILADVDANEKVNVKDATAIQKYVADIETGFPIGQPVA